MDSQDCVIETLVDHLLLRIFLFLPATYSCLKSLRLVNRYWNQTTSDLPVWHRFKIRRMYNSPNYPFPMADYMAFLHQISTRIHRLHFCVDFKIFPDFFSNFPTLSNLTWLDCTGSNDFGLSQLDFLVRNCPKVVSVNLSDLTKIDDNCLIVIATEWKNLLKISISGCYEITPWRLIHTVSRLHHLQKIKICHIDKVTDEVVDSLAQIIGQSLKAIVLGGGRQKLTESAIISIAQKCPNVEKLIVNLGACLTDKGLQQLRRLHILRRLEIVANSTRLSLLFVGQSLPLLRYLNCTCDITDDHIQVIVDNCPQLQVLRIGSAISTEVSDRGIDTIMAKCSNLVELRLTGMRMITGRNLLQIPVKLPTLKVVRISCHCDSVTRETVNELKELSLRSGFKFDFSV